MQVVTEFKMQRKSTLQIAILLKQSYILNCFFREHKLSNSPFNLN